jgi:hypothetical protein
MNLIFDIGTHLEVIQEIEQFFPNCFSQNSGFLWKNSDEGRVFPFCVHKQLGHLLDCSSLPASAASQRLPAKMFKKGASRKYRGRNALFCSAWHYSGRKFPHVCLNVTCDSISIRKSTISFTFCIFYAFLLPSA